MYHGKEMPVKLRFENRMVGAVIDRFGKDVMIIPDGDKHFTVTVQVVVSPQFFAWACGFDTTVEVIGPTDVVKSFGDYVLQISKLYQEPKQP